MTTVTSLHSSALRQKLTCSLNLRARWESSWDGIWKTNPWSLTLNNNLLRQPSHQTIWSHGRTSCSNYVLSPLILERWPKLGKAFQGLSLRRQGLRYAQGDICFGTCRDVRCFEEVEERRKYISFLLIPHLILHYCREDSLSMTLNQWAWPVDSVKLCSWMWPSYFLV